MTYAPTFYLVLGTFLVWLIYDIWVVNKHGARATESWLILSLWILHPLLTAPAFALVSHFFWPRCGVPGDQSVGVRAGTMLGITAVLLTIWEMAHRGWMVGQAQRLEAMRQPPVAPRAVRLTLGYGLRLLAIAVVSFALGHLVFAQYVECAP